MTVPTAIFVRCLPYYCSVYIQHRSFNIFCFYSVADTNTLNTCAFYLIDISAQMCPAQFSFISYNNFHIFFILSPIRSVYMSAEERFEVNRTLLVGFVDLFIRMTILITRHQYLRIKILFHMNFQQTNPWSRGNLEVYQGQNRKPRKIEEVTEDNHVRHHGPYFPACFWHRSGVPCRTCVSLGVHERVQVCIHESNKRSKFSSETAVYPFHC